MMPLSISLAGPFNSGVAAGGAGIATANSTTSIPINGVIHSIYVRYNDTPPATTDVTIATSGTSVPALTLLTLTNANTDGWFNVQHAVSDNAGAAIAATYIAPVIGDSVKVTIAQANNSDSADVWFIIGG